MKSLETINTGIWSNIPVCIIQDVNSLIEYSKGQQIEIENLQNSVTDLTIKFGVKTSRYDAVIQDLSNTTKLFNTWATSEIVDIKTKTEDLISNTEKKMKNLIENNTELKTKYTTFYGEFRKEVREFNNKLEKLKGETNEIIYDNFENTKRMIERNDTATQRKILMVCADVEDSNKKQSENLKIINEKILNAMNIIQNHKDLIDKNEENLQVIKEDIINKCNEKIDNQKLEILNVSKKLDSFILPAPAEISSSESAIIHEEDEVPVLCVNPFNEKFIKIEETLASLEISNKTSLQILENKLQKDMINIKNNAQIYTNEIVETKINENFLKLKNKLEWLPEKSDSLKGMSVTEARLFILESRIRGEEKARIISDQKIKSDILEIKDTSSVKNSILLKRSSLSPAETKVIGLDFSKARGRKIKTRPSSSYHRSDSTNKAKNLEMISIKIQEPF